jgi:capsular polysaccharide biosynthesis protein
MTVVDFGRFIRRWWWLLIALPLVGLIAGFVMTRNQPYVSDVKATVLIPFDTEDPGNSERPELMILDDSTAVVSSFAFAELVHAALPADLQGSLSVDDVKDSLAGSRYSRVLTVTSSNDSKATAEAIATAVARVLPAAVNMFMVADGAPQATVRVIDPASDATQDRMGRLTRIVAQAAAAFVLAAVLAFVLDAVFPKNEPGVVTPGYP